MYLSIGFCIISLLSIEKTPENVNQCPGLFLKKKSYHLPYGLILHKNNFVFLNQDDEWNFESDLITSSMAWGMHFHKNDYYIHILFLIYYYLKNFLHIHIYNYLF